MEFAHIVKSFDEDLAQINQMVMEMGGIVEQSIEDAAVSLVHRDLAKAAQVIASDKLVDSIEEQLEEKLVRVLALRQPQAQDLRLVVAVFKVAADLERIGDYAKNLAKRVQIFAEIQPNTSNSERTIKRMCLLVQKMLKDVLDAYIGKDAALAEDVWMRDEQVDQMHDGLFRELLTYMMEDPRNITPCMHLLFIAKNVERMGDHTTSIAEQVIFLVSGAKPTEKRPKSNTTLSQEV